MRLLVCKQNKDFAKGQRIEYKDAPKNEIHHHALRRSHILGIQS